MAKLCPDRKYELSNGRNVLGETFWAKRFVRKFWAKVLGSFFFGPTEAGLGWAGLDWAGPGLGWAGLGWAGLGWVLGWVLGWAGLGWAGLGWAGLGWAGWLGGQS